MRSWLSRLRAATGSGTVKRHTVLAIVLAAVISSAAVGWVAGRQVRSPAEIAAGKRPPRPSLITVPLDKVRLTADVVTRGTVGFGSPAIATLPVSTLKQGNRIVTVAPKEGAVVPEGGVAFAVSARPVIVLQGEKPTFRDLVLGDAGDDVLQLEAALARKGHDPGLQDAVVDRTTLAALDNLYRAIGFGPPRGGVPADEVLFFPKLPVRIGEVTVKVGDAPDGPLMTVTNSEVTVAASLSAEDAKLVREGAVVTVQDPDRGLRAEGTVRQVATAPGTNGVEPQRFFLEVIPKDAPDALVGSSVVVNVAVSSTEGEVLAAPVAALSTSADGTTRLEVEKDGKTRLVAVRAGLVARGMVEVAPLVETLQPGDRVVVGATTDPNRS